MKNDLIPGVEGENAYRHGGIGIGKLIEYPSNTIEI